RTQRPRSAAVSATATRSSSAQGSKSASNEPRKAVSPNPTPRSRTDPQRLRDRCSVLAPRAGPSATLVPAPRIGAVDQGERADRKHEKQYEQGSHSHTVPVRLDKHKSSYRSCR